MKWMLLATALSLLPLRAMALDSNEFHLYGRSKNGGVFDITPFGPRGELSTSGDPDQPEGIHGRFYRWRSLRKDESSAVQIGVCRVENRKPYTFSCKAGHGLLAGAVYEGEKVTSTSIKRNPEALTLYKQWLRSKAYGDPAAFYTCKSGCTDAIPTSVIFVWYGD